MRVVITGATGNVGTSLVDTLAREDRITSVVGIARRVPALSAPKATWQAADVSKDALTILFEGADAVVHLAWAIQPSRDAAALARTNVLGSERVFAAAIDAGVGALIHASSVGTYAPGPADRAVDEGWPADGVGTSFYSRHKAIVERLLSDVERRHPSIRVVRLRPALTFKRGAASEIRRYFLGPFFPNIMLDRRMLLVIPAWHGLRFQAVHAADVADAYRLALVGDVRGSFNIAADPVLDTDRLEPLLGARRVTLPATVVRGATDLAWRLRLQPTPPGWVDLALRAPVMDTSRARSELGWSPRVGAEDALLELLDGIRDGAGGRTPPLDAAAGGRFRLRELATGVGNS